MAHPYAVEDESYEEEADKRGWLSWVLIVGLLISTGSGSAIVWHSFGGGPGFSPFRTPDRSVANAAKQVEQADIEILRKQIANAAESTDRLIAAQQAEFKRLKDQMTALSEKLDLLQKPVTSAQASLPASPVAKPKKRAVAEPAAAKSLDAKQVNPSVSTAGAPLPLNR
jgi:uncharacterized coiled-coil protein SlyX